MKVNLTEYNEKVIDVTPVQIENEDLPLDCTGVGYGNPWRIFTYEGRRIYIEGENNDETRNIVRRFTELVLKPVMQGNL